MKSNEMKQCLKLSSILPTGFTSRLDSFCIYLLRADHWLIKPSFSSLPIIILGLMAIQNPENIIFKQPR